MKALIADRGAKTKQGESMNRKNEPPVLIDNPTTYRFAGERTQILLSGEQTDGAFAMLAVDKSPSASTPRHRKYEFPLKRTPRVLLKCNLMDTANQIGSQPEPRLFAPLILSVNHRPAPLSGSYSNYALARNLLTNRLAARHQQGERFGVTYLWMFRAISLVN
jgi:hypothetical protein